ncbi:MAG: formylglycine-generating enzyme family protein [Kiritimatiellae bacterium]|nr:formylglycine-generating enzyme family protein [Kiritimatiellia bacterium]
MKHIVAAAAMASVCTFSFADEPVVPVVSDVTMAQSGNKSVTIGYTLSNAPAVVTLDIETNTLANGEGEWVSIGGENIQNFSVGSEVWRKVEDTPDHRHAIKWHPDLSWPGHAIAAGGIRAVVKAWSLDNTPDYMVVPIVAGAQPNTQRYYPSAEFLPGGDHNPEYRLNALLMRRCNAKNVIWTMGSSSETGRYRNASDPFDRETAHPVMLTNNYYIGVYEITQAQWNQIQVDYRPDPSYFSDPAVKQMRPVERVSWYDIRVHQSNNTSNMNYLWPNAPNPSSFLGRLRSRTGIDDFDLPSEAEWEFACRAGNGEGCWGDGSAILAGAKSNDANLSRLARYYASGGYVNGESGTGGTAPAADNVNTNGTAVCGSYLPNAWGIYDMHGNVSEWCLDIFEYDITHHDGRVNVDPADPSKDLDGNETFGYRVQRGGCYGDDPQWCRSAMRVRTGSNGRGLDIGFRVACRAGLK